MEEFKLAEKNSNILPVGKSGFQSAGAIMSRDGDF